MRPRDHQPPFERRDPLEHARHVALGIVAIGERLVLVAERQAAEEDHAVGIVVLPQAARRPLAAGLLDDGQLVAFDLDVAEERFEALVRLALGGGLAELDQAAIVASGRRRRPRQRRRWRQQLRFPADIGRIAPARIGQGFLPREAEPGHAILVGVGRDLLPDVGLERRPDFDARDGCQAAASAWSRSRSSSAQRRRALRSHELSVMTSIGHTHPPFFVTTAGSVRFQPKRG